MLRNTLTPALADMIAILNEVLSLNAQEWNATSRNIQAKTLLNEVLSLNAQEFLVSASSCGNLSPQ